jgi:hypothetical protein
MNKNNIQSPNSKFSSVSDAELQYYKICVASPVQSQSNLIE